MTRKAIFAGAYGIRSQGDDAALLVMIESLRRRYPDLQGTVICRHAEQDLYAEHGLRSLPNFEYATREQSLGKWFRGFNIQDDRSDLCHLQQEIAQSDLLVLGAGNALVDYTIDLLRGPIPYFVILTLMAKMTGTPVMWFGISVGPLRTEYGRNLTRLAAQLADVITVRDERSIGELRDLGWRGDVTCLPDPVLGLRAAGASIEPHPIKQQALNHGGPLIAVSVRAIPDSPQLSCANYLAGVAAVCDRLIEERGASLLFVPQCTYTHGNPLDDDRKVAAEVVGRMSHATSAFVVTDDLGVQQTAALYAGAEAALCTRLHGNVSAAIEGVPTVALSYNPKVASFMQWLGCADQVVEPDIFTADIVSDKLEQVLKNRSRLTARMMPRIFEGRQQVERYADLAAQAMQSAIKFSA
jgi:polysaccharide pyruvyl transferase WcaK-like protein